MISGIFAREHTNVQFSFICACCGKPIKTNTVVGQEVILIYFKNGIEIERLVGDYDGFGGVFTDTTSKDDKGKDTGYSLERKKAFWKNQWSEIFNDHNDFLSGNSGICAIHKKCFVEDIILKKSEYDERGGYGYYEQ